MAVIYDATLSPTKPDVVRTYLDGTSWGGSGDLDMLAAYRLDDPAGTVGIEAHLVARGGRTLHVPLTYRGEPLDGADEHLIATMDHSVLGKRWVYAAAGDPVAVAAFTAVLRGEQPQADQELHLADGRVEPLNNLVQLSVNGEAGDADALGFTDDAAEPAEGAATLTAQWSGGTAIVAALR
ncbi:maltokinase N-terminal cap-like domain-containing protein [Gordonia zhaorongruii]|uniref:maltokinase N-terminal cap-like domain-containing protein n=1 Tax=Gordonia zhaorongruii TaxID=2597659 RepID=UPI00117F39B0|nr:hypothetical protein [Gordonia zhaorongruii]